MTSRRWIGLAAGVFLCASSLPLAAAEIEAARVWDGPESTRVVFDLSGDLSYKTFTLDKPDRLVIDLKQSKLSNAFKAPETLGVIKGFRTGQPVPGTFRAVFDLSESVKLKTFLLEPAKGVPHRLVLDLIRKQHAKDEPVKQLADVIGNGQRDVLIAIDAGHGGEDPGAHGPSGLWEKHVTLAIARALAERINREAGMKAYLTRDGDYFVPLKRRYEKARQKKADLFVSIHADAVANSAPRGSSVYVLSPRGASSEQARMLADIENQSDLVGGVSLDDKSDMLAQVLLDLSQSAAIGASESVAKQVISALGNIGNVHKRDVQRANFVVLRSPDVPSVLVETAFISNPDEEKKLRDTAHQARIADAILEGVLTHFTASPPPGTLLASLKGGDTKTMPRLASVERRAMRTRAESDAVADSVLEHVVSRGENLTLIAQRHGVSVGKIRRANNLRGDVVRIGTKLKIPVST